MSSSSMRNCWYPALLSEELKDEPYGIQILGHPLCFWRHRGKVQCVQDICPHRSAPLSVGRIVNGVLECKYHGWQFEEEGKCTFIPSAPDEKPKSCNHASSFPVKEIYDAIWVYIGDPVGAEQLEKKFPHQFFRYMNSSGWATNFGQRDLHIDHGLMVENLLDPSHLPFTHEGTLAKRSDAQKMTMEVLWNTATRNQEPAEPDEEFLFCQQLETPGFKTVTFRPNSKDENKRTLGYFTFVAPSLMVLDLYISKPKNRKLVQVNWCVPVTPTKMRFVYWFFRNCFTTINTLPGFNRVFRWSSEKIIDQDVLLLGGQQTRLFQGANPWNSAVSADVGGVLYRKWRQRQDKIDFWFKSYSLKIQNEPAAENQTIDMEDLNPEYATRFAESPSSKFLVRERIGLFPNSVKLTFVLLLLCVLLYFTFVDKIYQ